MTRAPKPPPPTLEQYAQAAKLREALRRFQRRSDEVASANGLTMRTFQLLLMVKTARGGVGRAEPSELEERLQLAKSTVTELVLRSEKRGLVRRELDSSRPRGIVVRLTAAGERLLATMVAELGDERLRLIEVLSAVATQPS